MAPDLNSLPPSRNTATSTSPPSLPRTMATSTDPVAGLRLQTPSPLSRTTSNSLHAAASVNAGLQHESSRSSSISSPTHSRQTSTPGRRRSAVLMNLQLNDPSVPPAGEMITEGHHPSSFASSNPHFLGNSSMIATGDPHHLRNPSLGEIHQELEQEQEAQVNRLLQQIRAQQQQLQQLQQVQTTASTGAIATTAIDDSVTSHERGTTPIVGGTSSISVSNVSVPRSPIPGGHPRASFEASRRSRTPSRHASPRLRATSISAEGPDVLPATSRDETSIYQAETQMMMRENQMLRMRIRELERQISDLHANSSLTHEPATASNLHRAESVSDIDVTALPSGENVIGVDAKAH